MSASEGGGTYGVFVGLVVDNRDPKNLGRVRVRVPKVFDNEKGVWARTAVPMAGAKRGTYFLPEVDDEVLVAFEAGDVRRPYVLGALWNGGNRPPVTNADGQNNVRLIKSRSGHVLQFDDTPNSERVTIQSKSGHRVTLSDADGSSEISVVDGSGDFSIVVDATAGSSAVTALRGDIAFRAPSGRVRLEGAWIEIDASGLLNIEAGSTVTVNGAVVKIN